MIGERTFTEVARRIYAAPLFSPRETEAILAIARRRRWRKARVRDKELGSMVKREVRTAGVQYDVDIPQLAPLLRRRIIAATKPFSATLVPGICDLDALHLVRYRAGGFFDVHKDNPGGELDNHRQISVVVYLNDDFTGGATAFVNSQFAFTPRAGWVLLFPSDFRHQAEPVVEGTKYIIAAWYVSPEQAGVSVLHDPAPVPDQL